MKLFMLLALLMSTTIACSNEDKSQPSEESTMPQMPPQPELPDFEKMLPEVVAVVDSQEITRADVVKMFTDLMQSNPRFAYLDLPNIKTKEQVRTYIEDMCKSLIVLKIAEKEGFKPSPELFKKLFKEQFTDKLSAEQLAKVQDELAQQRGTTLDSFIETRAANEDEQKRAAINAWVMAKLLPQVVLTDSDVASMGNAGDPRAAMDAMKNASDTQKANAMNKLQKIADEIKAGADFAAKAKENSDCPSGQSGGDLGEFERGQMVPEFDKVVFEMQPGEVSCVFPTGFGYHIIKLESKSADGSKVKAAHILVKPRATSLSELKPEEVESLKYSKIQPLMEKAIEDAKSTIKVDIKI